MPDITIPVKWMRENVNGSSIRFRYGGKMPWFLKKHLVGFNDDEYWFYNEPLEITVPEWYLRKIHASNKIHNKAWGW